MKKENSVKGEKGTMLIVATALFTKGIPAVTRNDYNNGKKEYSKLEMNSIL